MPRSFLVKKGRFSSNSYAKEDERINPRQQLIKSWPGRQHYPDISILQRHYFITFQQNQSANQRANEINNGNDEPIDYSLKKKIVLDADDDTTSSETTSECTNLTIDQSPGNPSSSPIPIDTLNHKKSLTTDGRTKRRKHATPTIGQTAKFSCQECGKNYATSSNLSRHKQTHRSIDSNQAKKCPHCDKVYVSMPALSMHILTHKLKHECTLCDKAFSRPWLLQGHMRSHTGERPYDCMYCRKKFADRSNLRAHMQTHAEEKEFQCEKCGKTFAVKTYLTKHLELACQSLEDGSGEECDN